MGNKIDLTGQVFGRLTVLHEENPRTTKKIKWTCQCECGTIKNIYGSDLRQGKVLSCGCLRNERVREAVGNKLEGQRFGRLVVLRQVDSIREPSGELRTAWECQCDCGNKVIVKTINLKAQDTMSCGCLVKDKLKERRKDLTNQRFGKLIALKIDEKAMKNRKKNNTHAYWLCKCDCGNYITVNSYNLTSNQTQSCGCIKSQGETIIASILSTMNYRVEREYSFQDLKGKEKVLRFDFALFKDNILKYLIEFNGQQHYEPIDFFGGEESFKNLKENDLKKQQYCKEHNIPLIIIPYTDKNKINLKYLEDRLK